MFTFIMMAYFCVSTRSINILIMIMLMTFFWGRGQKYNTTADVFEYLSSKKKIYMIFKILFWGGGRSIQQLENGQKFKNKK